jgi:hypothetical protein
MPRDARAPWPTADYESSRLILILLLLLLPFLSLFLILIRGLLRMILLLLLPVFCFPGILTPLRHQMSPHFHYQLSLRRQE